SVSSPSSRSETGRTFIGESDAVDLPTVLFAGAPTMIKYFTHGPTLAYRTYGHGPMPLLAFHGFGRTGQDFHVREGPLGDLCTVYAFDLHYHGNSAAEAIRAEAPVTPKELATFFAAFMDELGAEKVMLLGYS